MFEDDPTRGEAGSVGLASSAPVGAAAGGLGVAGTGDSLGGGAPASRVRFVSTDAAGGPGDVGVTGETPIEGAGGGRGGRWKVGGPGLIHDYDLALLAGYRDDWVAATKRKAEAEADQARALAKIVALSQHVREEVVPAASDSHDVVLRSFVAECATRVHVSDRALLEQCAQAWNLATRFPSVLTALGAGQVTTAHVRAIVAAGSALPGGAEGASARAWFEARALELATELTPGRLRTKLRSVAESLNPVSLDVRHEQAVACRRVWVRELDDGMAEVGAEVSAVLAYGIFDRLSKGARATKRAIGATGAADPGADTRGMDQLRADIFADLLLTGVTGNPCEDAGQNCASFAGGAGGAGGGAGGGGGGGGDAAEACAEVAHATGSVGAGRVGAGGAGRAWRAPTHRSGIHGITPTITLLLPTGEGAEHATLSGYGPIDGVTARQLSAIAPGWNRVGLNEDGGVTGTDRYRLTEAMRRTLEARDQHCRFPGCRMPTHYCDVDHTVEWMNGGETRLENQAFLCRRHHALKHPDLLDTARWSVRQESGGTLIWTSPLGVDHADRPEFYYTGQSSSSSSSSSPSESQPKSPPEPQPAPDQGSTVPPDRAGRFPRPDQGSTAPPGGSRNPDD
ncbi:DUF222 domain-containing protein [Leucobacter sp. W1153]|uniref:HNH endonuclease signature motif containing protein n=1 Tax=Leucobacter sp. W1153 TaxID=3439064 RepID=UPI003F3C18B4